MKDFQILAYKYMNTGGNTMVGIFDVWMPSMNRVVYMLTNEEGCTMAAVDYISNELNVESYEDLQIENVDWGRITGFEKHFELYRHCFNVYNRDDCKFFGITRRVMHHLLSDELIAKVHPDYIAWTCNKSDGCIETDGDTIVVDPDYSDEGLQEIKSFKKYIVDVLATDEDLNEACRHDFIIVHHNKAVRIPFNADTHDSIELMLDRVIEEWQ